MLIVLQQVSLPKISLILQKMKIGPKSNTRPQKVVKYLSFLLPKALHLDWIPSTVTYHFACFVTGC